MSIRKLALSLAVVAATCLGAAAAHAANARTWVSNTGSDTDNFQCSVTAPCLTFAQAIAETSSGGEINCLNPGGFGAVTISISVTIDCGSASNGGIMASSGNAITINTAGTVVNLLGLDINGDNGSAQAGLSISAAATVNIRNCKIYGFANGPGIFFSPNTTGGTLVVDNVLLSGNSGGIQFQSNAGVSNLSVRNSNIDNNVHPGILLQMLGGTHAGATIEQTTLAFNGTGLLVSGSGAVALIGGSTVVNNTTGVGTNSGGIIYSFKNNQIGGNSTDGTPLTAYPGGPLN